jgi:hypothetical protein
MRTFAPALLLLLAAPIRASAVDVSGRLGLAYDQQETSTSYFTATEERLNLDGALQANGALVEPELGLWRGTVGYHRLRNTYSLGASQSANTLVYSGNLSLLDPTTAPASLSLSADRSVIDSTGPSGNVTITGTQTISAYGGDLRLSPKIGPALSVGASLREADTNGFAVAPTSETTRLLRVGAHHGTAPYDLGVTYEGRWNEGDVVLRRYTAHAVDLNTSANLGSGLDGFLSGRYYLRIPDATASSNPEFETNQVVTGVRMGGPSSRSRVQYAYNHQFFSSTVTGELERIQQTVSGFHEISHSQSWDSSWTIDATVNQDRRDETEASAYGASLAPLARWQRRRPERNLMLEAGPTVGVLKPADGGERLGSGGHVRGRVEWARAVRTSLDYAGDYARNLRGLRGSSLHQAVTGGAEGTLLSARGNASLTVSTSRQHDAVFSLETAARDVLFRGSLAWRRLWLQLEAERRDGTTPAVGGVQGDGLFIPSSFDSHTESAGLGATWVLWRSLSLTGRSRYARLSGPEIASQEERSLHGILEYALGQVQLSVEDRYTEGGARGRGVQVNEVMVRLTRSFGARF